MAKFKVGDTAFVFDDWDSPYDGRGGKVVKVDRYVHIKFPDGNVAQFAEDELTKTANAARSRNAVVQKALNAQTSVLRETAVNGSSSPWGFFVGEEVIIKRDPEKKKHRIKAIVGGDIILEGVGPRFDASELDTANYAGQYRSTNATRKMAVNANASRVFKPGEEVRWEYIDGDGDSGVVVADKGSYLEVRLRDGSIEKPSKMLITSNASRSTNAVVAKALNALQYGKPIAVGDRVRWHDRYYGSMRGTVVMVGDRTSRVQWDGVPGFGGMKPGAGVFTVPTGELVAENASRVARNARQVEMPKIPQGAKGRRDLEKVVKRINEAYKMDGARQSSELTSIKNELVWDTAYYTSGLSGADKAEMMKAIRFLMSKCKVRAVKPKGFTTSEMYD